MMLKNNKKDIQTDDKEMFKFIDPKSNNNLSKMSGLDLQDLIILVDNYYIRLRDQLGLEKEVTFGLELEFERAIKHTIESKLSEAFPAGDWVTKCDGSLNDGLEINSPILIDTLENWKNLDKVCSIVEPLAKIDTKSGGHIHIGTQTLGDNKESWLNFLKMWSVYENIIFRFAYGEFLTARPSIVKYATPMAKNFWEAYEKSKSENASLQSIISMISHERYQAVNFDNVSRFNSNIFNFRNTIEFRCPNGSLDAVIWQNNVNLFAKMLSYCRTIFFNDDIVEKRHQLNLDRFSNLRFYDEIYLEQALELCDMVFSNNLDKIYFLKQYLKSFEICNNNNNSIDYPKAKKLTKKIN